MNSHSVPRVILAYDFMRLTFQDCLWAHKMNSVLTIAFPPETEDNNNNYNDKDNETEEDELNLKNEQQSGKVKREYNNVNSSEIKEKDRNNKKLKKVTKKSEEFVKINQGLNDSEGNNNN